MTNKYIIPRKKLEQYLNLEISDEEHGIVFNILHEIESMEEDETYQVEIFKNMLNEIKEIC